MWSGYVSEGVEKINFSVKWMCVCVRGDGRE